MKEKHDINGNKTTSCDRRCFVVVLQVSGASPTIAYNTPTGAIRSATNHQRDPDNVNNVTESCVVVSHNKFLHRLHDLLAKPCRAL